jgi:hypothetical protein
VKLPHLIHHDPDWQVIGANQYHQCRCGARRVRNAYANRAGPVAAGWPPLLSRHGYPLHDTGWAKPPPSGWDTDGRDAIRMTRPATFPPPPVPT